MARKKFPYTCAQLFSVEKQGPVSVGDLVKIMIDLEAAWPGVEIEPARKSEGGFEFKTWPGKQERERENTSAFGSLTDLANGL